MKKLSYSKPDIALIYGVMLGDGCLSRVGNYHYFFQTCGHIKDDAAFLKKIKPIVERIRGAPVKIKKRPNQGELEINFSDKAMFVLFQSLGFPVGKKGDALKISSHFKVSEYKHIIKGYFATDGCLVLTNNNGTLYPRIEFSSISKTLLEQVLSYLEENGMSGKIYVSHNPQNGWSALYRLQLNGKKKLSRFVDVIGFVNPKHESKLAFYKRKSGGDGL